MSGRLLGVGVGPGDPALLTLRAVAVIRSAPVIAYPAPDRGDAFARRIAAAHIPAGRTEIAIRMPMIPAAFPDACVYDAAAAEIAAHLRAGRDVACLCAGDPFVFGSFLYLHQRLAADHPTEIIPGVSAIVAGAAAAGAPLAARNDRLAVLPATLQDAALEAGIAGADSIVFLKLGRHAARLRGLLDRLGLLDRAVFVAHASGADQRVAPFATVDPTAAPYFSLVLLHKVGASA